MSLTSFVVVSRFDLAFFKNTYFVLFFYTVSLLLLVATLIFGDTINGAKAWINLGVASFQPVDLMKLSLAILLAKYFSKRHIEIQNIRHIIVSFVYVLIPSAITMMQPDLGSTLVLLFIWFVIVLCSGLSKKHLFSMIGLGIVSFILAWNFAFAQYQKNRILNFLDPLRDVRGSGYNVYQAQIAIGSGGWYGKGVGFGTQSRLNFLPEYKTDFIFSAYAEEWGYFGVLILIVLYASLHFRILFIAGQTQNNFFYLIAMGIFAWIFLHTLINIGMNLALLPVTGIPLPFLSYGGTSFLMLSLAVGMIASIQSSKSNSLYSKSGEFLGY